MASPTLQAEGTLNVVTTGDNSPTIPTHQTDDILVVMSGFWGPNTTSANVPATPTDWTRSDGPSVLDGGDLVDGASTMFWRRATGAGHTITITRPSGWDTGNDTAWGCRAYVIRGCITTGDPWDELDWTVAHTAANQAVDAITVSGSERLVVHFLVRTDDYGTAPTLSGWTTGTQVESTTGTDHSQASHRKTDQSSSTSADTSSTEAPVAGFYAFLGLSFKPPSTSPTVTPGTASLTTTRFTPKVTIDQKFIPGVAALVTTRFTPTVRLGFVVVPGIASLTTTRFTPSVTVTNNILVVPGIATLTTTRFTPTVQTDTKVIPGIGTLTLTRFTPTVRTDTKIIPGVAALVTTRFTPTVTIDSGGLIVTPGAASLTLTRFAPTVLTPRLVTPGTAGLVTTGFAPTVLTPRLVVPGVGTLTLTRFAPTVLTPRLVIPGKGTLVLTPFSPTLTILTPEVFGELFPFEFLRHVALVSESSDSAYPSEG